MDVALSVLTSNTEVFGKQLLEVFACPSALFIRGKASIEQRSVDREQYNGPDQAPRASTNGFMRNSLTHRRTTPTCRHNRPG